MLLSWHLFLKFSILKKLLNYIIKMHTDMYIYLNNEICLQIYIFKHFTKNVKII